MSATPHDNDPFQNFKPGTNPRKTVDINCDLGEGMETDASIMSFISSANIACGYHAGDEKSMWRTMELAVQNKVRAGAHVSFLDRENFGRTDIDLSPEDIYELVEQQLLILNEIADGLGTKIWHVKPHGALYSKSAIDATIASAIANAVMDFDKNLLLFGLSGSHSITKARKIGLKTCSEVFADRTYQDNGTLTPRTKKGALIENADQVKQQVLQMVNEGLVTTTTGATIKLDVETICIHGDGPNALEFARTIREALRENGVEVAAP